MGKTEAWRSVNDLTAKPWTAHPVMWDLPTVFLEIVGGVVAGTAHFGKPTNTCTRTSSNQSMSASGYEQELRQRPHLRTGIIISRDSVSVRVGWLPDRFIYTEPSLCRDHQVVTLAGPVAFFRSSVCPLGLGCRHT